MFFINTYGDLGTVWFDISGMQNGSPDGIALYDTCNVSVIQFLSYEGTMTATSGPANGQTSVDIGIDEQTALVGHSLQLIGTGNNYAAFSWAGSMNSTHDQVNTNQYFCLPTPGNPCTGDSSQIKLVLTTELFGYEISWSITDSSSNLVDSGSGYLSNSIYYDTVCIANCALYQFNMYDSYGDGWN